MNLRAQACAVGRMDRRKALSLRISPHDKALDLGHKRARWGGRTGARHCPYGSLPHDKALDLSKSLAVAATLRRLPSPNTVHCPLTPFHFPIDQNPPYLYAKTGSRFTSRIRITLRSGCRSRRVGRYGSIARKRL